VRFRRQITRNLAARHAQQLAAGATHAMVPADGTKLAVIASEAKQSPAPVLDRARLLRFARNDDAG
jgi:DNA-directed RNA polymerase subunit K/omega